MSGTITHELLSGPGVFTSAGLTVICKFCSMYKGPYPVGALIASDPPFASESLNAILYIP